MKSSLGAGGPPEEWVDSLAVWCGSGEPSEDNDNNNENDEPFDDKDNESLLVMNPSIHNDNDELNDDKSFM